MGDALHPVARERIEAAYNEVRSLALDELPEALFNGSCPPSEFAEMGERVRAAGEAIVRAASLPQIRRDAVIDDATCPTCRAADSTHHLLEGGSILPPPSRCEHVANATGVCRCRFTAA